MPGRPRKYHTREERLQARRKQSALRYQDPRAREARALQNQRAYEKLRVRENADIQVPDDVRECASTPWRFKNEATIARFRAGPASLSFGGLDLGEEDLRELSCGLPQYSPSATALPSNFAECWDILSAALYGYHLRVYMEGQVAQLSHCGMRSKVEFSDQLLRQYRNLLSRWETLVEFISPCAQGDNRPEVLISKHNARWTADQIVFMYQEIQAFAQGGAMFVSTLNDRHRYLGSLYSSPQF
ncbi:hypothetical protein NMY22_g591 [Coprinellus aureogranulatus]|nr:hypothetical protein NMY22_g591 [Coprinellus aureogranulatus]